MLGAKSRRNMERAMNQNNFKHFTANRSRNWQIPLGDAESQSFSAVVGVDSHVHESLPILLLAPAGNVRVPRLRRRVL